MTISILNHVLSKEKLDEIYTTEYYWYLKSKPIRETFIKPLAKIINRFNLRCLDVACGEGWLADYVSTPYVGFDGSKTAIIRAKVRHPKLKFHVGRIEDPPNYLGDCGVLVFGGIFDVLVRPGCHIEFLRRYHQFDPKYIVVYDLEKLDESELEAIYGPSIERYHGTAEVKNLQEVKKHRKILVYQCN